MPVRRMKSRGRIVEEFILEPFEGKSSQAIDTLIDITRMIRSPFHFVSNA